MSGILTDREIDDAADKLAAFRTRNAEEDFLQRYADLLTGYKQLKSDYEEEKVGRERYKQLARNHERNPFVLVIVDGDGYIFKDDFLHQGADGGSQAAQHLNNVIKKSLQGKGLEHCDVMIRIYANLANLSRILSKYGLATPDKRSLSPFVANFNRSYGLMDFVDAGELKENADFKIRALLNLYADNFQCKHIYFAACHDVGYLSELTRFRGDRKRFTLIRSSGLLFHDQFHRLDLGVEEFSGVFRTIPLDSTILHTKPNSSADLIRTTPPTGPSATANPTYQATSPWETQKACQFYQAGKCRFGGECKNAHIDTRISTPANSTKLLYPSQTGHRSNADTDITSSYGRMRPLATASLSEFDSVASSPMSPKGDPSCHLPRKSDIPDGYVAVNKHLQRLDAYMPPPNSAASSKLRELSSIRKLCNNKQLTNSCPNENCEYEHKPIPEELRPALEWLSRSLPCTKRGNCRAQSCVLGHICQNTECQYRGGKIKCKLPGYAHSVDLTVDQYIPDPSYTSPVNPSSAASSPGTLTPSQLTSHVNQVPGIDPWDFS
ncbi:hypothetical protein E0Z10_g1659 [Xylaria hypoxylon]|uniref:C3H1-type domain-containing protein n=1 Tax=Xylaria hypoxylon TaxID=37992 RepID=A0A4Z0Z655_9PEZI|nr:hypothetical protein E0Z10_g1659 [Xylaria hypoxylon]